MKQPRIENGIVVGTASNKYETKNPIARYAIAQLLDSVAGFVSSTQPSTILELGCGEGRVTERMLAATDAYVHATDLSSALAAEARARLGEHPRANFSQLNIYDLEPGLHQSDVVVCCEVLEHLEHPEGGLRLIAAATKKAAVLSVPREPNFRVLNFLRGQHFADFGNAPGHVQHWSSRAFQKFVEAEFTILKVKTLLPWTVILAQPKALSLQN